MKRPSSQKDGCAQSIKKAKEKLQTNNSNKLGLQHIYKGEGNMANTSSPELYTQKPNWFYARKRHM